MATKGKISIGGEVSTKAKIDVEEIVRNVIKKIGYKGADIDIDYKTCIIDININKQSPDIALRNE